MCRRLWNERQLHRVRCLLIKGWALRAVLSEVWAIRSVLQSLSRMMRREMIALPALQIYARPGVRACGARLRPWWRCSCPGYGGDATLLLEMPNEALNP
jgi:hypothetical protein